MARIVMAGFETGDTLAYGSDSVGATTGSASVVSATPTARSGTYCFRGQVTASFNPLNAGQQWATGLGRKVWAHASATELWYAFGCYAHHANEITAPGFAVLVTRDTSGLMNAVVFLDSGTLRAYYPTAGGATPDVTSQLTLIGAASSAMSMDAWHLIEVHVVAATGATGTFELYLDGTSVISATSQRTAQTNANLGSVELGLVMTRANGTATHYHAIDDVRVNSTSGSVNNGKPGDGKVLALLPNGVGTTIGGTPLTGTPSSTNWQNVDDVPPSATDYNSGTGVGTGETYALADPSGSGAAQAVNVIAYALNADNGGGSIGITTKTAAGTSEGSAQAITATSTYYQRMLDTDPSDSGAWSLTKLSALEAGITVR